MNPNQTPIASPVKAPAEKSLSQRKIMGLRRYPCDGQPRYAVKVSGKGMTLLPYGEAYKTIFESTGGRTAEDGHMSFSREGIRRIMVLNEAYLKVASTFVITAMSVQNAQITASLEAIAKQKEAPAEPVMP